MQKTTMKTLYSNNLTKAAGLAYVLAATLLLPACSDSTPDTAQQSSGTIQTANPTTQAFTAPLKAYLDAYPQCFVIHDRLTELPGELQVAGVPAEGGVVSPPPMSDFLENNSGLAALEKLGFITLTSEQREGKSIFSDEMVTRYFITIAVADKGKPFYRSLSQGGAIGKRAVFCYGAKELAEISNVQEQQDTSNKRFANVDYTYRVTRIEPWAKTPEFEQAYPQVVALLPALEEPQSDKTLFIMNSRGEWVNENIYTGE